jgi:hypothetical protein
MNPPTFLERWGVIFISAGGLWMLGVCIAMLWCYLAHLGSLSTAGNFFKPEDLRTHLELQKTALDQLRASVAFAFDLMVTKTILPPITPLLGYLFEKKSG